MAQEITEGLFSSLLQNNALQQPVVLGRGAMTPVSALTQRITQSGEQLQGSVRRLFGQQTPEEAQAQQLQEIKIAYSDAFLNTGIDPNTPEGLTAAGNKLINNPNPNIQLVGHNLIKEAERVRIANKSRETKLPPEIQQNLFVGGKFYRTYEELQTAKQEGKVTQEEINNAFKIKKSETEAYQNARDPLIFLNNLVKSGKYTMESIGEIRKAVLQNPNNPEMWYGAVNKLVYKVDPKDRRFNEEAYVEAKFNIAKGNATEDQKIFVEMYEKMHPPTKDEENPFKKQILIKRDDSVQKVLSGGTSVIDSVRKAVLLLKNKDEQGNTFKDSQGKEIDGTPFSGTFADVTKEIAKIKQKAVVSEEEELKIANTEFIQSLTADSVLASMQLLGGNDSIEELNFMREVKGNRLTLSSLGREKILSRLFKTLKNNYNKNIDIFRVSIKQDDDLYKLYKYYNEEIGFTTKGTPYTIVEDES